MQRRALAAESDYGQKDRIVTIQQLLSFSADTRERGGPSLTHRPHPTANFIHLRGLGSGGSRIAGSRRLPLFPRKRDRTRAELFLLHRKSSQCTQISPQGHRVRAPCPNKRRKDCVCHRVSNNEDADPHTILNALLVLAI